MSTIPTFTITPGTITPGAAADAYARTDAAPAGGVASASGNFGNVLQSALDGAVAAGHAAETKAVQAIAGEGNLTEVVTALSRAELALQTTTAIRDRVIQAYQDIIKMPI